MDIQTLRVIFWLVGNINAMLLFLAPTITFKKIISNKSTQEFSGIPYAVTLLNCLVTGWYSIYTPGDFIAFILNMAGVALELIYVIIFIVFAQKREKCKISGILVLFLLLFGAIIGISFLLIYGKSGRLFCGVASAMSSIAMYASPLFVMRMVIRTKSTEFMPFFLSFFVFLYATARFIVGLLERDNLLAVASGMGSVIGIIQLILYARFRNNIAEKYKFAKGGSLESGLQQANLENHSGIKISPNRAF